MPRRIASALFVAALVACSSDANPDATKPGATVFEWQLADSDRASIVAAKISEVEAAQHFYEGVLPNGDKVKVSARLETATVEFEEDGELVTHAAPVKLTLEAVDAAGYTLSLTRCMGPHYTMDLPPAHDMILQCYVKATKPRTDLSFVIYAYGDGRVDGGKPSP